LQTGIGAQSKTSITKTGSNKANKEDYSLSFHNSSVPHVCKVVQNMSGAALYATDVQRLGDCLLEALAYHFDRGLGRCCFPNPGTDLDGYRAYLHGQRKKEEYKQLYQEHFPDVYEQLLRDVATRASYLRTSACWSRSCRWRRSETSAAHVSSAPCSTPPSEPVH
jgi:hypothetical protein